MRLDRVEYTMHTVISKLGRMNLYGSEGPTPTAKEREQIKKKNEHGLILSSLNKSSIKSALDYVTNTVADVVCVQELSRKLPGFYRMRAAMLKGSYMNRCDGSKDPSWRMEGRACPQTRAAPPHRLL